MNVPKNYTKLYVSGTPIDPFYMGYLCGRHNIFINHFALIDRMAAILAINYDKEEDLVALTKETDYKIRRIFKHEVMKQSDECRTHEARWGGTPVWMGFVMENVVNVLGLLHERQVDAPKENENDVVRDHPKLLIECDDRPIKKVFLDKFLEKSKEKDYEIDVDAKGNIRFVIKVIRVNNMTTMVTWMEGDGFTNMKGRETKNNT